mmetsp:Transcript_43659/g.135523  ORF Transcript_43659/g.135523 Transcript_43659/m.135523 type:complete len:303 (+) Transcript_43659:163-1071(+)
MEGSSRPKKRKVPFAEAPPWFGVEMTEEGDEVAPELPPLGGRSRREADLEDQLTASRQLIQDLQWRLEAERQKVQPRFWPFRCFQQDCAAEPLGIPLGRQRGFSTSQPRVYRREPEPHEVPFLPATPAEALDVMVECVHALGMDVDSLPRWQRRLAKRIAVDGSWPIGPSQQPETFKRFLHCSAGDVAASGMALPLTGCFFELSWEPPCLYLRKPAPDLFVQVDGQSIERPAHALLRDAVIALGGHASGGKPRIAFRVLRDPAMQEAAIDAWLFRTAPDATASSSRPLKPTLEPNGSLLYSL